MLAFKSALLASLLVGGVVVFRALSQQPAPIAEPVAMLSSAQLKADVAILRRALEELHPGLYRSNTKTQMDAAFAQLDAACSRDLSREQAFLALSKFTAGIRCGHTFLNPTNQSRETARELFERHDKIPFHFRWIDRRMFVTRNLSEDPRLVPGSEILEINGSDSGALLDRLMTIARADGSSDAKRVSLLEVRGDERYETFDIYFPMFFPLQRPSFDLRIAPPAGAEPIALTVPALTYAQRAAPLESQRAALKGGDAPVWELKQLDDRTALLVMPTWAVYDSKWDWTSFLNVSFDTLIERATANLVIDLRGNEGGSSVGDLILSRLIERDTRLAAYARFVRYRKAPTDLNPYLDTWDSSFKDWGESAVGPSDGFYRLKRFDDRASDDAGDVIRPSGKRYAGRVFVLVDASNSSATFEFAFALKQHKLATLVGQPTGGNQRGINGGAFFFLRLPASKLEVDLPLIAQFPMPWGSERPDTGVSPDVLVSPAALDLAQQTDAELEAVKRLIREGQEPRR